MTPKQKAQELYRKTYKKAMQIRGSDLMTEVAREFALLTVDEMLEDTLVIDGMRYINDPYWLQVKQELEKL